jgi:hypothetical protein
MQLFRFLGNVLSKGHGLVLFLILLLLGFGIRHLGKDGKETVVAGALSSVYYPAQLVVSSVNRIHSVAYENDSLKKENARLKMERDNLREGLEEMRRLRELVHFNNVWDYSIVTARVIGRNPGRFFDDVRGEPWNGSWDSNEYACFYDARSCRSHCNGFEDACQGPAFAGSVPACFGDGSKNSGCGLLGRRLGELFKCFRSFLHGSA